MSITPVILCGGSGTRLWPLSRASYPKQYLSLAGSDTLLQQTVKRIGTLEGATAPLIISNNEQRFLVAEQLRAIDTKPSAIVLEPVARNTAPAVAAAALIALRQDANAMLLVLPSDHVIANEAKFLEAVRAGRTLANDDFLVTFGIPRPRRIPATATFVVARRPRCAPVVSTSISMSRSPMQRLRSR